MTPDEYVRLESIRDKLIDLANERPALTLKDLGRTRREGLQPHGMSLSDLAFLYDRFSLEILHPSKLIWEVVDRAFFVVFEMPADVYAYYFPALLVHFVESLDSDDGHRFSYVSAFTTSINPECSIEKLKALAPIELQLLRDVFTVIDESGDPHILSWKKRGRLLAAIDDLLAE